MKPGWLLVAIWIVLAGCAPTPAQKIKYWVEKSDDSLFTALSASIGSKKYTVIDKSDEACLAVVDQRDWDGKGSTEALVERITGCGGNCCPSQFFFVSPRRKDGGKDQFEVGNDLADSWSEPVIEKWKDQWSVVIVSTNEGSNRDPAVEITRRFVLRAGKATKVEESRRKDMESLLDLRSDVFQGSSDEHSIQYDLDGDGKNDEISGKLWDRWGRIFWTVRFANGKEYNSTEACKRIGVLAPKTKGVNDLVCDQDKVYRWDGQEYQ